MRKLLFLALVAIVLMGCGPAQQEEQVQEKDNREIVIFRSETAGFYEMPLDSLEFLTETNDENFYYVVDKPRGSKNFCVIIFVGNDEKISKMEFRFSSEEDGTDIELESCAISDKLGNEYLACSPDCEEKIEQATSLSLFPILDGILEAEDPLYR